MPDASIFSNQSSDSRADLGVDILCKEDLDPRMRLSTGIENLAWATAWRLKTSHGELFYAPNYGHSLVDYCHETIDQHILGVCRSSVQSEVLKDDRIASASTTVQWNPATRTLTVNVVCQCAAGKFQLVASADGSDVAMRILS